MGSENSLGLHLEDYRLGKEVFRNFSKNYKHKKRNLKHKIAVLN